ncbi:MAG: nucleotide exchange factor GrpE [Robiginitomaculum sp.]|nr:nucleotide exchange factor GrpE [Robiginitomaculum sp.]
MNNEQDQPETEETPDNVTPIEEQLDPVIALQGELEIANDRTLRLAAELENLRKRSQRDIADAKRYAVTRFAEDMLNVADNLSRALDNVPAEAREEASQRMEQLVEGVDITQKSLQAALERHGIEQINAKGEKFDHNLHQAVAQIPSNDVASGLVAEVIQNGYTLGDRTLRAAIVAVSTGASASAPAATSEPEQKAEPGSTIDTKA